MEVLTENLETCIQQLGVTTSPTPVGARNAISMVEGVQLPLKGLSIQLGMLLRLLYYPLTLI